MTGTLTEKLGKWRVVLAGWHAGSFGTQPGVAALRDEADHRMMARIEMSALANLLLKKGVFTLAEYQDAIEVEAVELDREYQRKFPGFRATAEGIEIYDADLALQTTERLGFPP